MVTDRRGTLAPPVTMVLEGADGASVIVQTPLHFDDRFRHLVAQVPGFGEFFVDERFATLEGRRAHLDEYLDGVRRAFRTRPSAEWLAVLREVGVPAGPVQTVEDLLSHPQMEARQATTTVEVGGLGTETVLASPFVVDGERRRTTAPPPILGQDTDAVLTGLLGYGAARLAELASAGAFGPARPAGGEPLEGTGTATGDTDSEAGGSDVGGEGGIGHEGSGR